MDHHTNGSSCSATYTSLGHQTQRIMLLVNVNDFKTPRKVSTFVCPDKYFEDSNLDLQPPEEVITLSGGEDPDVGGIITVRH